MAYTPVLGLPAPDYGNAPDIPGDIQKLAAVVENMVVLPALSMYATAGFTFPQTGAAYWWAVAYAASTIAGTPGVGAIAYGVQFFEAGRFRVTAAVDMDFANSASAGPCELRLRLNGNGDPNGGGSLRRIYNQTILGQPVNMVASRMWTFAAGDRVEAFVTAKSGQGVLPGSLFEVEPIGPGT